MSIPYERIVKEDLNTGWGTTPVTMPGGGTALGTLIGLHSFTDILNVKDFGAVGDGVADDTEPIQGAIDEAVPTKAGIFIPPGVYRTRQLDLSSIGAQSDSERFGFSIRGAGQVSVLKCIDSDVQDTPFIKLAPDSGSLDRTPIFMDDLALLGEGCLNTVAMTLHGGQDYSQFRNLYISGFRAGIILGSYTHGIVFVNPIIRMTQRQAIYSTGLLARKGLKFYGGLIELCGREQAGGGGNYVPALHMNYFSSCDFFGTEFRDNYAGTVYSSYCENVRFWGCRFEDDNHSWSSTPTGVAPNVIAANSTGTKFFGCSMKYSSLATQYWASVAGQAVLDGCEVVDSMSGNGAALDWTSAVLALPNTTFTGCTPPTSHYRLNRVPNYLLATGAGATVDNVITALQALGLVKQS